MGKVRFLGRRLLRLLLTVAVIASLAFVLMRIIPGDPALQIAGIYASSGDIETIRHSLGTDRPLGVQYLSWMADVVTFDFGNSLLSGRPVSELIFERFPLTGAIAVLALLFSFLIGLPLGCLSALKKDTGWDHAGMVFSQLLLSIPNFWLGILLLLAFAVALPVFPLFSTGELIDLVLPSIALGAGFSAMIVRHTRNSLIDEMGREYVTAARAKGLPERRVVLFHALPNALLPVITLSGIQAGHLLGGAVIIEQVFSLPGLGRLILTAVTQRDFPLVQGGIVFLGIIYSLVNCAVDILCAAVNPRLKTETEA